MTRWLVIVAAAVLVAFIAIIAWPRPDSRQAAQPAAATPAAAAEPASFTVLIDGQEVTRQEQALTGRLADLPVSSWESSMISSIRNVGTTQIAVFVDGSESIIDSFVRSRMPADVAFRAGYGRE